MNEPVAVLITADAVRDGLEENIIAGRVFLVI